MLIRKILRYGKSGSIMLSMGRIFPPTWSWINMEVLYKSDKCILIRFDNVTSLVEKGVIDVKILSRNGKGLSDGKTDLRGS